jgi:hypothetical protein
MVDIFQHINHFMAWLKNLGDVATIKFTAIRLKVTSEDYDEKHIS